MTALPYLTELRLALDELIEGSEQSRDRDTRITALMETCELAIREVTAGPDYEDTARAFVEPYEKLSDDLLAEIAEDCPGNVRIVHSTYTTYTVTSHIAKAILDFRAVIAKARATAPQSPLPASSRNEPGV